MDQTINLNEVGCLRTISHFGHDTVRNICTNADVIVPWGELDWLLFVVACAFVVVIVGLLAAMIRLLWRES